MPGKHQPALLLIRGGLDYGDFLERLAVAAHGRGLISRPDRTAAVELACARLGRSLGLDDPPQRARPHGSNQHGDAPPPKRRNR